MNVTVVNTLIQLIAYLESKAVGDADLVGNIYTGPNEERDNSVKKFICLLYEYVPLEDELGDVEIECPECTRTFTTADRQKVKFFTIIDKHTARIFREKTDVYLLKCEQCNCEFYITIEE